MTSLYFPYPPVRRGVRVKRYMPRVCTSVLSFVYAERTLEKASPLESGLEGTSLLSEVEDIIDTWQPLYRCMYSHGVWALYGTIISIVYA